MNNHGFDELIGTSARVKTRRTIRRAGLRAGLLVALALTPLGAAAVPGDASAARLRNYKKQDSALQSGAAGDANGIPISLANDPFEFTRVGSIVSIQKVTVIFTMHDGDTGAGDYDEDRLVLALDGVDTGIELNGFRDDRFDTQTITAVPEHPGAILKKLKEDGRLAATIIDRSPGDGGPNEVYIAEQTQSSLTIAGKRR